MPKRWFQKDRIFLPKAGKNGENSDHNIDPRWAEVLLFLNSPVPNSLFPFFCLKI
jgi:hypothetical protein